MLAVLGALCVFATVGEYTKSVTEMHFHAITTLKQHITNLEYITNTNIANLPKKSVRKVFRSHYEILWKDQLRSSTRGTFFLKFKQSVYYEKYLDQLNQRNLRCPLSKIRDLSHHELMIEQGRKTLRQEQICVLCDDGTNRKIEDEVHFLFEKIRVAASSLRVGGYERIFSIPRFIGLFFDSRNFHGV